MNIDTILNSIRQDIAQDIFTHLSGPPRFDPLSLDPYVAASVLQKSVRRGEHLIALRAAARLLESDPTRLWRRLLVIAFEDIGIADIYVVGRVVATHGQKRWRTAHGGEWQIVAYLVSMLSHAAKDRTADDLLHLAENDPALRDHRRCWSAAPIEKLTTFMGCPDLGLPEKALAVWFGIGTDRYRSDALRQRGGFPEEVFATYKALGVPGDVLAISWTGHRKMSWPLAAFMPLVWLRFQNTVQRCEPDPLPSDTMIGDAPSYALDAYTRSGKAAMRELLRTSMPLRRYLSAHAPEKVWPKIAAVMLFRVEGGLMSNRLRWTEGDDIKASADMIVPGLAADAVPGGQEILRSELPALDTIRQRISGSNLR